MIHELGDAQDVEFYGPLAPRQNWYKKQGLFGPQDFALEEHGGQRYLRCPGGQLLCRVQAEHEEGADHGSPGIVPLRPDRSRLHLRVDPHGAELQDVETRPILPYPLLPEQDRSRGVAAHASRDGHEQGP